MWVDRWWPLLYVAGAGILAVSFSTGAGIVATPAVQPGLVVSLFLGAVLLAWGTVDERWRRTFIAGMALIQFGCMLRAWDVALTPVAWQTRVAGPVIYVLVACGLGLCAAFTTGRRISGRR